MRLVEVGGAVQDVVAVLRAGRPGFGGGEGGFDIGGARVRDVADEVGRVRGVAEVVGGLRVRLAREEGRGLPDLGPEGGAGGVDLRQRRGVAEVEAAGVGAAGGEEVAREVDARRRGRRGVVEGGEGVGGDLGRGDGGVDDLVHEGGVGAVLEQSPDEVGEEVAVRAHGGVDAGAGGVRLHQRVVQRLAHAVEALEFEVVAAVRHFEDGGRGVGVVGGELGVDAVGHAEEFPGAADVGDVGRGLAGPDGEVGEAVDLGALHFRIPVGALDEADHDAAVEPGGQRMEPVDDGGGALAVALHDDAEAVPARERGVGEDGFDEVEGELEAVGLLGVDVEAHAGGLGLLGEREDHGREFGHDAGALPFLVAGVEGGELDRDAGVGADVVGGGLGRERRDRAPVGGEVVGGVLGRHRGFAQHVVGEGEALRGLGPARA